VSWQSRSRVSATPISCFVDEVDLVFQQSRFHVSATSTSCFGETDFCVSAKSVSLFGDVGFVFRRSRFHVSGRPISCFGKVDFARVGVQLFKGHGKSLRCEPSFVEAGYLRKLTDTALVRVQPFQSYGKSLRCEPFFYCGRLLAQVDR